MMMPDWTIGLTIAGLTGLYVSVRWPRVGWALSIAMQPGWFAFGVVTGRWWFWAGAPVYAGAFTYHLVRDVRRERRERVAAEARALDLAALQVAAGEVERVLMLAGRR